MEKDQEENYRLPKRANSVQLEAFGKVQFIVLNKFIIAQESNILD